MTWLETLWAKIRGIKVPAAVPPDSHRTIHKVTASSFADPQDLRDYAKSGSFAAGDNGVGCWGDNTAQEVIPMCALPPEDMVERWGSVRGAKHKRVTVRVNGREVVCVLADRMPHRVNIKNGAGIDLNPGAAKVLGLRPPFTVAAEWEWV